jgi:hypothetical protein
MIRKSLLLGSGRALVQAFGGMATVNGERFLMMIHDIIMGDVHLGRFTTQCNKITECQKCSPESYVCGL